MFGEQIIKEFCDGDDKLVIYADNTGDFLNEEGEQIKLHPNVKRRLVATALKAGYDPFIPAFYSRPI